MNANINNRTERVLVLTIVLTIVILLLSSSIGHGQNGLLDNIQSPSQNLQEKMSEQEELLEQGEIYDNDERLIKIHELLLTTFKDIGAKFKEMENRFDELENRLIDVETQVATIKDMQEPAHLATHWISPDMSNLGVGRAGGLFYMYNPSSSDVQVTVDFYEYGYGNLQTRKTYKISGRSVEQINLWWLTVGGKTHSLNQGWVEIIASGPVLPGGGYVNRRL